MNNLSNEEAAKPIKSITVVIQDVLIGKRKS